MSSFFFFIFKFLWTCSRFSRLRSFLLCNRVMRFTCPPSRSVSDSWSTQTISEYWAEASVLCSGSPSASHSVDASVHVPPHPQPMPTSHLPLTVSVSRCASPSLFCRKLACTPFEDSTRKGCHAVSVFPRIFT